MIWALNLGFWYDVNKLGPKKDSNFIKCYFLRNRAESWRSHVTEKGQTLGIMSTKRFQFHKMLFSENQAGLNPEGHMSLKKAKLWAWCQQTWPPKKIPISSNVIFWEPGLNHEGHMSVKRDKLWVWCQQKDSNFTKCYFLRTRAESGRSHVTEKGKTLGLMTTDMAPQKRFQFYQILFSENQHYEATLLQYVFMYVFNVYLYPDFLSFPIIYLAI